MNSINDQDANHVFSLTGKECEVLFQDGTSEIMTVKSVSKAYIQALNARGELIQIRWESIKSINEVMK